MDYYVKINHDMTREHHILFVAQVYQDRISIVRLYPEQGSGVRLPYQNSGQLYLYCTKDGLYNYLIE